MLRVREVKISVDNNTNEHIKSKLKSILNTNVIDYKIIKRSIDARDENNVLYVYTLDVEVDNEDKVKLNDKIIEAPNMDYIEPIKGDKELNNRPIIIGFGPAGMFAAYTLAEYGYKPIVFERGKDVDSRIKDVNTFFETNKLNINSNIQFGEGGAGTFSDGKLNTLINDKNNRITKVFNIFVENGAPEDILYDYHPHIGTDKLRTVVKNIRNKIIEMGGEIHFESQLTDIDIEDGSIKSITINNKDKYNANPLILAIGHSARDTFRMLNDNKLYMEAKPFAVGLRVIHDQRIIDYGLHRGKEALGHASYKCTYQTVNGRGVYSFCMCPGGYVINASSEEGKIAVNGMSNYDRASGYANSAIIVTVDQKDYGKGLFAGMEYQEELERKTYELGKGFIPIQLYKDFKENIPSKDLVTDAILGKYTSCNLRDILPNYISESIIECITDYGTKLRGYDNSNIILCGTETRTSSPIRILREPSGESFTKGIYPCGEGAGYAGGITSAAIDGIKQAENIISKYKEININ